MKITYDLNDGVALIGLDDGKKNAITEAAVGELNAALDRAEAEAGAIVVAGRPGSFCAGFDLSVMTGGDAAAMASLGLAGGRFARRLYATGKPLVAACTGHAFTIGALWLLACDTRIGVRGAFKFSMNETRMGMALPPWALALLRDRIDRRHYLATVAQSKVYDPEGAVQAGFLDALVDEGEAVDAALAHAAELAGLPAKPYAANKLSARVASLATMENDLG